MTFGSFLCVGPDRWSKPARVPVLDSVLDDGDQDVLGAYAGFAEPLDDGPDESFLGLHAIHVHHRGAGQGERTPTDPVVGGVAAELARTVRGEDLEEVVGGDVERLDLRLVHR